MATFMAGWPLSIMLVSLRLSVAAAGRPAAPSSPSCHIPWDDENIYCIWDHRRDPQDPANYSLHWLTAHNGGGQVNTGTNWSGFIHREHFSSHSEIIVWVLAENRRGGEESQKATFDTGNITKPPPPKVTSSRQDPFDISWDSVCNQSHLSLRSCDVRYRTEVDRAWIVIEIGARVSYEFSHPIRPGVIHEVQVRCACSPGLTSDWSAIHRISSEAAPVGQLDVWRDCETPTTSNDCVMIWKKLQRFAASGLILGYEVGLSYSNGTVARLNVSSAEPSGLLVCDETRCSLNSSLKDVLSASVSAYNSHGATVPSHLAIPAAGGATNREAISVKMNAENLSVSWDLPPPHSHQQYVVQYKQVGSPPGRGFDWIRVNKSNAVEVFKGHFQGHTTYQVSLFTVSPNSEIRHHSSVIGFSLQGTPPKVPSFKVDSIADTHVTLIWEPVPLSKQNGLILHYQIGVVGQSAVNNVSASPWDKSHAHELRNLSPGQEYEVWIKAVTAAGPGANVTLRFKTKQNDQLAAVLPSAVVPSLIVTCCLVALGLCSVYRGRNKACPLLPRCLYEKVPDPRNSLIFKHMKHQISEPLACICAPTYEEHPKISVLEVVEMKPPAKEPPQEKDEPGRRAASEESHATQRRYGREEYSKIVDSDEERGKEDEADRDDCWSSEEEEEEEFTSGYEKHFMPTVLEIQEV